MDVDRKQQLLGEVHQKWSFLSARDKKNHNFLARTAALAALSANASMPNFVKRVAASLALASNQDKMCPKGRRNNSSNEDVEDDVLLCVN